jgi:hypothetical protein
MKLLYDEIEKYMQTAREDDDSIPDATISQNTYAIQHLWTSKYIDSMIVKEESHKPCYVYVHPKCTIYSFGKILRPVTWKHIMKSIHLLDRLFGPVNESISIGLAYSHRKKMFPPSRDVILNATHVNSGLSQDAACLIYRNEEMHKVILHELLHIYSGNQISIEQDRAIEHELGIQVLGDSANSIRLNEARIDMIACIILCAFRHDGNHTRCAFLRELRRVRRHIFTVAGNVMKFYQGKAEWIEDTHVFSYYVAKAIAFRHLKEWDINVDFYKFISPYLKKSEMNHFLIYANDSMSLRMHPIKLT